MGSLMLVTCAAVAQVEPAELTTEELTAKVRRLERQLNDDSVSRRNAARQELIELGPRVLDVLSPVKPTTPAEVKQHLEAIRKALEAAAAEVSSQASHVTLRGEMSVPDAFTAIAQQSGNKLAGFERREGAVDVDFDKTPFWPALDKVLDQAALTIDDIGGAGGKLYIIARTDEELPRFGKADYQGIFRFEGVRVNAVRSLRTPALSALNLAVQVAWEPRAVPISLSFPFSKMKATTDTGDELLVGGGRGEPEVNVQRLMTSVEVELPLTLPGRDAEKITSLRGTMSALILGRTEQFEFTDLAEAKNVEQSKAGAIVTFQQLRKNVDLFEARVKVRFEDPDKSLESHRDWHSRNQAILVDSDGNEVRHVSSEAFALEDEAVGRVYLYDLPKGPTGHKFVYKTPGKVVRVNVDFQLKDIPLP